MTTFWDTVPACAGARVRHTALIRINGNQKEQNRECDRHHLFS
jgi:hypothetical protein